MRFNFFFDDTDPAPDTNEGTETNGNEPDDGKKYTDADLDRIIGEKFKKWQKQQEKKIDEAKKLAEMTAQERAEHERDELQKELNALKAANTRADMERQARAILNEDGITIPDALIASLVRDDAEATSEAVKAFATTYKDAVTAGVTAQLAHKIPSGGAGAGTITKADIMKEKDTMKRQKLIRENLSLFR